MSQQRKQRNPAVTEGISALLVQQPFFASLMLDLMEIEEATQLPDGSQLSTCATNGHKLWINVEKFAKLSVQERVGMLAHEIMHVILQHAARKHSYINLGVGPDLKKFSTKKFDNAADYIINAHLTAQGFKLPLGSLQNSQVTGDDIIDEVYLKLPDEDDGDDRSNAPDDHVADDGQVQTSTPMMQAALQKAKEIAKMQGKGTAGMDRTIEQICDPQVPWQDHLRKAVMTNTRGRDVYTWTRPNRRKLAAPPHVYLPGRAGTRGPKVGVVIDTSGSIGEAELTTFLGELSGILSDIEPEMVYVVYVDSEVHEDTVHEIDDVNMLGELGQKSGGGGGTDMPVGFQKFEDEQLGIEAQICFTDGYTPFGEDKGIPTIWAITSDKVADWGTTVHVDIKSQE